MRYQFFFDESGKSNLSDSTKSGQEHLVLAGVLIPWDSVFWEEVKQAWIRASVLLGVPPQEVELHGTDVYGGKGPWKGVDGRLEILNIVVGALRAHHIRIYWIGLPVEKLAEIDKQAWRRVLVTYLSLLSERLRTDLNGDHVEIYGDANEWVKPDRALENPGWSSFSDRGVRFQDSKEVHGIQIADIIAHTIYRSNKDSKSGTDAEADKFRRALSENFTHLP